MRLEQRVARLEAAARELRDDDDGVLLSPYDVAVLIIEQGNYRDTPEGIETIRKIDALLDSHWRACIRQKPERLTPKEATEAVWRAAERDGVFDEDCDDDPDLAMSAAGAKHHRERFAELMAL